jgi:ketosteroid isomerase-like protein
MNPTSSTTAMSTKDLIGATTETWNARDREGYLALYTDDCEIAASGFTGRGHDALGQWWEVYMTAFPDHRITVLRVVGGNGDAPGAEESVIEGTHTGPLQGTDGSVLPPTGRHMSLPFCMVHEQRGGRLVASRLYSDEMDLLTQLGALDQAATPPASPTARPQPDAGGN